MRKRTILSLGIALSSAFARPAFAHHGKDFLLLETTDMPLPGHVYALGSVDTNLEKDGARSTEITPGLLFGVGRFAFEPHFHLARAGAGSESDSRGFKYDATAFEARYNLGALGKSGVRLAVSGEIELPRNRDEHSEGGARLIATRLTSTMLVALNLIAGRELASGGTHSSQLGLGFLAPLSNGNRVGVEFLARLPLHDGVEIVPGYYAQIGKKGRTGLKIGPGYYFSRARNAGTLHVQISQMF